MQINNLICLKLPDQQILIFYCNNKCHFYKSLQIRTMTYMLSGALFIQVNQDNMRYFYFQTTNLKPKRV